MKVTEEMVEVAATAICLLGHFMPDDKDDYDRQPSPCPRDWRNWMAEIPAARAALAAALPLIAGEFAKVAEEHKFSEPSVDQREHRHNVLCANIASAIREMAREHSHEVA